MLARGKEIAFPPSVLEIDLDRFRKIAVFGGVYNNYLALEAAIEDAKRLTRVEEVGERTRVV